MKKLMIVASVVALVVMFSFPALALADECVAAPAVAGKLLEEAGIDNRYGTGRDGGNYIREVANYMGPGTDFKGVSKCDVEAYKVEVAKFLVGQGAKGVAYLFQAELESVVYEGTCNLFGSHIDDTITFTFSNDVFHEPNVEVKFQTAMRLWEGWEADNWTVSGNVATLTLYRVYTSPRDVIGDKVISITGLVDFIDNPVVVPSDGVEVEGIVTYDMVGTWILRSDRLIVIDNQTNGEFSGKMTDAGGTELGNINGTIEGDSIEMYYDRVGYATDGYFAEYTGAMIDCNTASGIRVHGNNDELRDGDGQPAEWTMVRQ